MEKKRDTFFLKKKEEKISKKYEGHQKEKRQGDFDKNRKVVAENLEEIELNKAEKPEKKPFDKKTYRLKKYSKKYKLEQWEEQRKKKLLREYHKDIKNIQNTPTAGTYKPRSFDEDVPDGNDAPGRYVKHPDLIDKENSLIKTKKDPYQKAKEHFNKVKQEKLDKQQEIEKAKAERKQKLEEYKKKKHDKFKKLSKKSKKGQPVMTGRLELLLEKIQNSK